VVASSYVAHAVLRHGATSEPSRERLLGEERQADSLEVRDY
jgi:hypothetical protein